MVREEAGDAIVDLLAALAQVLIIILIGFTSAKLKIIPPGAAAGIGLIVGTFALPALFLLNAAAMDISSFDVRVLIAVLLARYIMVALVSGATQLLDLTTENPKGSVGIYALFCTQSNDVAIGLPIVTAIYPVDSYPANYPGYLIIISTLQVVLVNPVCITLIEWGKSETTACEPGVKRPPIYRTVLKGVATSPLVLGSLVGVIMNLSCGRTCLTSGVAGDTFVTVGNAFTFSALFLTGMSMDARSVECPRASLDAVAPPPVRASDSVLAVALVLGKSLILPILMRLMLSVLLPNPSDNLSHVRDFGYLYGTLPVASLPVVLANQNRLRPAMVAVASVASTFVSMPLLVASSAVFLSNGSSSVFKAHSYMSKAACMISIPLLLILFGVFKASRPRWTAATPMLLVLHLALSQFLFHGFLLGCEIESSGDIWNISKDYFYWFSFYARTSMNTWLSNLALYFVLLARNQYRTMTPMRMWVLYGFGWVFPIVVLGSGYYMGIGEDLQAMEDYHATCWYRTTNQVYPDMVLTVLYMITFVGMFGLAYRSEQESGHMANPEALLNGDSTEDGDDRPVICDQSVDRLQSKAALDKHIRITYSTRIKVVLAIGFLRLCFLLTLQLQMLSHVSPDGSFNVQMLFAVVLVDGGGAITALTFLWANPVCGEIVEEIVGFCARQLSGLSTSETPWLGNDADRMEQTEQWSTAFAEQFVVRPESDTAPIACRRNTKSVEDLERLANSAPNSVSETQYMYVNPVEEDIEGSSCVAAEDDVCGRHSMPTTNDELSNSRAAKLSVH